MKKKSTILILTSLLVVMLVVGGTMAWFTAKAGPVTNEFTAGTVDLELIDIFEGAPKVNPGDCYSKKIYVKNTGTKRAYIRIKADAVFTAVNGDILSNDVLRYGIVSPVNWGPINLLPGWTQKGEYFYYNRIVHPGYYTQPLLKCNRICFDGPSMGNEYQGAKLDITINAEAIQATHGAIQAEWGVSFPTVVPYGVDEPVEEMLTEQDVLNIIAEEEEAFNALGLE